MPLSKTLWRLAPAWGLGAAILVCALVAPVAAQPRKGGDAKGASVPAPAEGKGDNKGSAADKDSADGKKAKSGKDKVKNFDFNALDLNGRMRTPQLLYFLERANEELERASLEKRSFIPHMVRSVEEEQL